MAFYLTLYTVPVLVILTKEHNANAKYYIAVVLRILPESDGSYLTFISDSCVINEDINAAVIRP